MSESTAALVAVLGTRRFPERVACRHCSAPIRTVQFSLGPQVMHFDPDASYRDAEWRHCRLTVATLPGETESPVPQGTRLRTNWGPAVAGRTWPDDPNQEVIYQPGAVGGYGADIAGTTGAFPLPEVRRWAELAAAEQGHSPPAKADLPAPASDGPADVSERPASTSGDGSGGAS